MTSRVPKEMRRRSPKWGKEKCVPLSEEWWNCLTQEAGQQEKWLDQAKTMALRQWGLQF